MNDNRRNTGLNAALADMDEKKLPDGRQKVFSIAFITRKGEYKYIHRAVKSGLRANMKANDLKAVLSVDQEGEAIDHVHPVWIHAIVYYHGTVKITADDTIRPPRKSGDGHNK